MPISDIDGKTITIGALASLVGYVFYGFINLQAEVKTLKTKQDQVLSEQRDLGGKYNDAGARMMDFMIEDAKKIEQLKEKILQVRLEESNRELNRE
jgi:hypothetical protein